MITIRIEGAPQLSNQYKVDTRLDYGTSLHQVTSQETNERRASRYPSACRVKRFERYRRHVKRHAGILLIERDRPLSAVVTAVEGCLTEPEFIAGVINYNVARRVRVTIVLALNSGEPMIVKSGED